MSAKRALAACAAAAAAALLAGCSSAAPAPAPASPTDPTTAVSDGVVLPALARLASGPSPAAPVDGASGWSAVATTDPGTGARTAALAAVQALSTHGWTSSAPSPASDGTWTFTAHTGPDGAGTWTVVSAVDGPGTSGAGLLYRTVTPPPAAR